MAAAARMRTGASVGLKHVNGRLVSDRSKSGDPQCSQAMSSWKTSGMTKAVAQILAGCRAKAAALRGAVHHRLAGHEGKAQALEHRAKGDAVTKKDRLARARALRADRAAKLDAKAKAASAGKPAEPHAPSHAGPKRITLKRSTPAHRHAVDRTVAALEARQHAERSYSRALQGENERSKFAGFAVAGARYREAQTALKAARRERMGTKPAAHPPAQWTAPTPPRPSAPSPHALDRLRAVRERAQGAMKQEAARVSAPRPKFTRAQPIVPSQPRGTPERREMAQALRSSRQSGVLPTGKGGLRKFILGQRETLQGTARRDFENRLAGAGSRAYAKAKGAADRAAGYRNFRGYTGNGKYGRRAENRAVRQETARYLAGKPQQFPALPPRP